MAVGAVQQVLRVHAPLDPDLCVLRLADVLSADVQGLERPLGHPAGAFLDALVLVWMSIDVYVLWSARSRLVAGLVYVVFTIPATIALLFGPAILLILQNET